MYVAVDHSYTDVITDGVGVPVAIYDNLTGFIQLPGQSLIWKGKILEYIYVYTYYHIAL